MKRLIDRAVVDVEVRNDEFMYSAFSHSVICTPLAPQVDLSAYSHLYGLELADCFDSDIKHIDILIGLDYFYDFVDGEAIRGSTGPAAIKAS